jgi:hypothetical protein
VRDDEGMLTFSANPSFERVSEASAAVLRKKPATRYECIGASELFIKIALGKQSEDVTNVGGFGYAVERNTRMAIEARTVCILSQHEAERGCKGGVFETVLKVGSFADDEIWLERLDLNVEAVKDAFEVWDMFSVVYHKKSLRSALRLGLKGHPRHITKASELIEKLIRSGNLPLIPQNAKLYSLYQRVIPFMAEYDLKTLIEMILNHREIGEALELYED